LELEFMSGTTTIASLTVTSGPDRGQRFALTDEFILIGSASDSQIVLTDPQVTEHQASLANRNGRFAISTPIDDAIEVDGNALKADQWVWLPSTATIKVSARTTLAFQSAAQDPVPGERDEAPSPPSSASIKSRKRSPGRKGDGGASRTVAKFITDRPGETLVRLGEDGHLPELALQEAAAPKADKSQKPSQGNPALVYGALGFSLLASIAMLFLEPGSFDEGSTSKAAARRAIIENFLGETDGAVKPYQRLLREAGLAYSRGDLASERRAYVRVLALLNSEDKNPFTGITGTASDDEELKKHLAVLLRR